MDRALPLFALMLALSGCDAGDPFDVQSSIRETTVGEAHAMSTVFDGQTLRMRGLVVLAHDKFDEVSNGNVGNIYIADSGNEAGHGMQIFAGQVRLHAYEQLMPGNIVNVQGAFVRFTGPPGFPFEDRSIDQFTFGTSIERVGFWEAPAPIEVTVEEWCPVVSSVPQCSGGGARLGRYVHTLIRLVDPIRATSGYQPMTSTSGRPRLDPFEAVTESGRSVLVSAELYRHPDVVAGTTFDCVTGVANYFFDDTIMPRGPEDFECD